MTTSNNGKTIILVIMILILMFFAFRSIFFILPFGLLPGISHIFRSTGETVMRVGDVRLWSFLPMSLLAFALFALWIYVIVWVYRDAERKGMNGLLWALLVLIGNIIGLIIYLIIRSETMTRTREANGERCPDCGNSIVAGFTFCPTCGAKLKPECPKCQKPVERSWKVCPSCGTNLDKEKIEQA